MLNFNKLASVRSYPIGTRNYLQRSLTTILVAIIIFSVGFFTKTALETQLIIDFFAAHSTKIVFGVLILLVGIGFSLLTVFCVARWFVKYRLGIDAGMHGTEIVVGLVDLLTTSDGIRNPSSQERQRAAVINAGLWWTRRGALQFYAWLLVTIMGGLIGAATLFLLHEQNGKLDEQTLQLSAQNELFQVNLTKDIRQTIAVSAPSKIVSNNSDGMPCGLIWDDSFLVTSIANPSSIASLYDVASTSSIRSMLTQSLRALLNDSDDGVRFSALLLLDKLGELNSGEAFEFSQISIDGAKISSKISIDFDRSIVTGLVCENCSARVHRSMIMNSSFLDFKRQLWGSIAIERNSFSRFSLDNQTIVDSLAVHGESYSGNYVPLLSTKLNVADIATSYMSGNFEDIDLFGEKESFGELIIGQLNNTDAEVVGAEPKYYIDHIQNQRDRSEICPILTEIAKYNPFLKLQ